MATGMQRTDPVWNNVYQPHLNPRGIIGNDQEQIQWMLERTIMEIAMNRFEWKGLPKEVSVRWLEMNVNFYGLCAFFFDPEFDRYFAMQAAPSGTLNLNGDPTEYRLYGNMAYQKTVRADKIVPIWGNFMRIPDWDKIRIYAHRLAVADRTIDINMINARRAKILAVSENMKGTAAALAEMIDEGESVIPAYSNLDINGMIGALDLGVDPDSIINMHILRTREWAEIMTLLGINNSNQDKKERLTAAETAGNDDVIATIRQTALKSRQIAADQINDMFPNLKANSEDGLGVTVDYVTDLVTPVEKDTDPEGTIQNSPANQAVSN